MTRRIAARGGLSVVVLVITLAAFSAPITAQIPEEFTNLKVLPEDIPQRQLLTIMRGFTRALGVRERYYGVGTLDFSRRPLEDFATGLLRADDLPGALAALELNLELYPEAWNSSALKGQVHMRSDQTEEAIAAFERSLEILPGNPGVLQVLERLKSRGD